LDLVGIQALVDDFLKPDEMERMGDNTGDEEVVDFKPMSKEMDEWGIQWKKRNQK
jgi:hypothetical protein